MKTQNIDFLKAACAVFLSLYGFIGGARADDWNKSTTLKVNEPLRIVDTILNPGRYILKLAPSASERHILQVFSAESGELILTTIAIPKYRNEVTSKTQFQFWEGRNSQAVALRSWFYPGDNYGLEFPEREARSTVTPRPKEAPSRTQDYGGFRDKRALVIGVSRPQDSLLNLRFAAKDAADMAHALGDPDVGRFRTDPSHIHLLVDGAATRLGIEGEIRSIGLLTSGRDLTFVFLSVHGIVDASTGRRYLSTFDTDTDDLQDTAFDMADFVAELEAHIAGRIVLVTDTCLGAIAKGLTARQAVDYPETSGRTIVISSSAPSEDSYESLRYQNSFFTHFFLQAMYQGRGLIDLNGIYAHVLQYVPDAVWNEFRHLQHPKMYPPYVASRIVLGAPMEVK